MIAISPARRRLLADLQGLISEEVGLRLAELASTVEPQLAIVEIGSYKGKSTCYLAEGARLRDGAGVVAIDPWQLPGNIGGRFDFDKQETRETFERQIERLGLEDMIVAVPAFSTAAASAWARGTAGRPIGMVFIDGSHTYADVRADFEAWFPHVVPGGIIVFDDYGTPKNPGVTQVVDEIRAVEEALVGEWEFTPSPLAIGRRVGP